MALIKYSIGPITSVRDKDSIEKREDTDSTTGQADFMAVCKKCGIQHMISKNEARTCCGSIIKADELS